MPTPHFQDTFTGGAGALSGHSPDIYSTAGITGSPGWVVQTAGLALTGAGFVAPTVAGVENLHAIEMEQVSLAAGYSIFASGRINASSGGSFGMSWMLTSEIDDPYVSIAVQQYDAAQAEIYLRAFDSAHAEYLAGPFLRPYGPFAYEINITGSLARFYIDGEIVQTIDMGIGGELSGSDRIAYLGAYKDNDTGSNEVAISEVGVVLGAAGPNYTISSEFLIEDFTTGGAADNALSGRAPTYSADGSTWAVSADNFDLTGARLSANLPGAETVIAFESGPVNGVRLSTTIDSVHTSGGGVSTSFGMLFSTMSLLIQIARDDNGISFAQSVRIVGTDETEIIFIPALVAADTLRVDVLHNLQRVYVNEVLVGQAQMRLQITDAQLTAMELLLAAEDGGAFGALRGLTLESIPRPSEFWTDFAGSYEIP